jgi:peroxiredoxin
MAIKIGERLPSVTLRRVSVAGSSGVTTEGVFWDKKVALIGVRDASAPKHHLASFVGREADFKKKGIDQIAVIAAHEPTALAGWGQEQTAGKITVLADHDGNFARAVGLHDDLMTHGIYSMLVENGVVKAVHVGLGVDTSHADMILGDLEGNPPDKKG